MKALITTDLMWMWNKKLVKIKELSNKNLRYIKYLVIKEAKTNKKEFWFGVHFTGYIEVIEQLLKKEKVQLNKSNTFETIKPINNHEVVNDTNRFLGKLNNYFPNSKLSVQISQQITNQNKSVTNQIITE